ncbi:hypothetical protein [Oceanobacillus sp. FSL H7-0719]|uniref:hypothetical protein n=1 Tax=Oceanobacillus sp. FSL H7-0719 TaxID=2954507 RepID=UPI00324B94ED
MSSSSLWLMDEQYNGVIDREYHNSWWFSPVVWDVLLDKYMHNEIQTPYGYKKSLIGFGGEGLDVKLNDIMNKSDNFSDRVCWELSNQQVFFTKDKKEISQAIKDFANNNTDYHISDEGISVLAYEHITERFYDIANHIALIDEEKYPYFIFKNTSVDDNVEFWFEKYNEENDEYNPSPLSVLDRYVTEFVVINDGKITEFIGNLKYEY